jgi:hypothetical protein
LRFVDGAHVAAAEMRIHAHAVAHLPAQEIVDGAVEHLAANVPQGLFDAGDGGHADDAEPPEGLAVQLLVEKLDARWVFADQHGREVFDCADDSTRFPLQRCLAPAI